MTNEYKIAILLPTRGRTEALDRSLIGLLELADDLDGIQLLLGLDTDDTVGIAHFQKYHDQIGKKLTNTYIATFENSFSSELNRLDFLINLKKKLQLQKPPFFKFYGVGRNKTSFTTMLD